VAIGLAVAGWVASTAEPGAAAPAVGRTAVAAAPTGAADASALTRLTRFRATINGLDDLDRASRGQARSAVGVDRPAAKGAEATPRWVRPACCGLTSYFGHRWGRMHKGIDIGAHYGAPIYAVGDGVITFGAFQSGFGRLVVISHGGGWATAYAHMSRFVRTSGRVHAGELIGYVGASGHVTGPHLHFEVRHWGTQVDPLPWLRAHGVRL
jgi:murein DD-endopeptidase MepM/ murein hydrolase activator NlpD